MRTRTSENKKGPIVAVIDIDVDRCTETAIRESEQRFRLLADCAPVLIWVNGLEEREFVNRTYLEYLGVDEKDVTGQDWTKKFVGQFVHPDDRDSYLRAYEDAVARRGNFEVKFRLRRADGAYRWMNAVGVPRLTEAGDLVGFVGSTHDIDDLVRAQHALKQSEKSLATELAAMSRLQEVSGRLVQARDPTPFLSEIVDAAIAITAADMGNIQLLDRDSHTLRILANRGFERPFLEFFANVGNDRAVCATALRREQRVVVEDVTRSEIFVGTPALNVLLAAGVRAVQSTPLVSRSGTLVGMLSTHYRAPRRPDDRHLRLLDLLARQAADAIERMQSEEARLQALTADRLKDQFVAMLAHELRNPLAALNLTVALMRRDREAGIAADDLGVMDRQVSNLTRLVDDLLDVTRMRLGKVRLLKAPIDLRVVVQSAIESVRSDLEAKRHELSMEFVPEPLYVEGDTARLAQVLVNLLDNAIKYTDAGGHVTVKLAADREQAVVRVKDSGIGVKPEMLPHVFDLFAQEEGSLSRSRGGLGLGLFMVAKIAAMHDGSVEAHSAGPGMGAEFVIRLPRLSQTQIDFSLAREAAQKASPSLRALRILVVEDNVDVADKLSVLLRHDGHEVRLAHEGPIAIAAVDAFRPEIVLLDIALPGMDGYEVARYIRQQSGSRNVGIVGLSGFTHEQAQRRAVEAGFDELLAKPVDLNVLETTLARVVVRRR